MKSRTKSAKARSSRTRVHRSVEVERFALLLQRLDACEPARDWYGGKTLMEAWNTCPRFDWMTWLFDVVPECLALGWRVGKLNGSFIRITRLMLTKVCRVRTLDGVQRILDGHCLSIADDLTRFRRCWPLFQTWPDLTVKQRDTYHILAKRVIQRHGEKCLIMASKRPCAILRAAYPITDNKSWIWYEGTGGEKE